MCSSVKSNRAVKKSQFTFDNELSAEQRLRFAAKANLAQARLEEREEARKRWAAKQHVQQPKKQTLLSWLKHLLLK
ncbi:MULTISPECIES: hypothetical protein [unclassified Pseudoalteromonas]|uniref:hypothetical protein n=1 Tax=unclassified Pseudoalteromonas TaxID=194690 RepID=UPI000B3C7B6C|nr:MULTISPECIES: hypothetical protein [unclassified Pseudoalteromonas]MDN3379977.1 hypothetical protein [Pseudoalteromonas sp. APC 3893]MDN3388316.1 hypothetical protein [Pseudoalteromonas sp. APC 4017]OUS72112.1 hypothetical protein B5G52_09675 [Pseudoalteromonas sp. A601]